jgi:hypothetical protein
LSFCAKKTQGRPLLTRTREGRGRFTVEHMGYRSKGNLRGRRAFKRAMRRVQSWSREGKIQEGKIRVE